MLVNIHFQKYITVKVFVVFFQLMVTLITDLYTHNYFWWPVVKTWKQRLQEMTPWKKKMHNWFKFPIVVDY